MARQPSSAAFEVTTFTAGGQGRIRIDALDKNTAAINFMNIEGVLVRPDQSSQPLQLVQTGPGVYEGEFDVSQPGSYIASFRYSIGRGAAALKGTLQTGLSVAYSAEYRQLKTNMVLLGELAERTGGRVLGSAQASSVYQRAGLTPAEKLQPVWEYLLRWMLLLFLLDVAVRRIAINPIEQARRLRRFIAEMGRGRQPAEATAAVLTSLRDARQRARQQAEGELPDRSARYQSDSPADRASRELEDALAGRGEPDKPVVAPPARPRPASEEDFTSRLLKAKRRARRSMQSDDEGSDENGAGD